MVEEIKGKSWLGVPCILAFSPASLLLCVSRVLRALPVCSGCTPGCFPHLPTARAAQCVHSAHSAAYYAAHARGSAAHARGSAAPALGVLIWCGLQAPAGLTAPFPLSLFKWCLVLNIFLFLTKTHLSQVSSFFLSHLNSNFSRPKLQVHSGTSEPFLDCLPLKCLTWILPSSDLSPNVPNDLG